jgi:hypothetical protein
MTFDEALRRLDDGLPAGVTYELIRQVSRMAAPAAEAGVIRVSRFLLFVERGRLRQKFDVDLASLDTSARSAGRSSRSSR